MKLTPKAQAALDRVVEQFQAGDLSPVVQIAKLRLPEDAPAAAWSFGNRVLAFAQTESLDCRGYRQWEAAGRHVVKGARAGYILAPRIVREETADGDKEKKFCGWLAVPVFGYHQTDGEEGTELDYAPAELPPLADVAERLGVKVSWQPTPDDRLGQCHADGSELVVGTHDVKTFFHELAHAVHARIEDGLKGGQDAHQETVAEFTATALMALYGLGDRTGNCWRYIQAYANDPLVAIVKALSTVEKILAVLTGEALASPVAA